ncbi:MAG TPA: hypothetical protein VNG11_00210 [Chloroflexota bacterium]|nr:hypothetical protein [Chloroflexota bacterium]
MARLLGNTRRRVNWLAWGIIAAVLAGLTLAAGWLGPALAHFPGI